jgi:hypothetical protein
MAEQVSYRDEQYIPDFLYGFVPPSWWPDKPRDYFTRTLNLLPLLAGGVEISSVLFSKTLHTLVFAGIATVMSTDDLTELWPLGQPINNSSRKLVLLETPAARTRHSSHAVPLDNMFGSAAKPALWPIPLPVQRGAALQVTVSDLEATARNIRLTFVCGVIDPLQSGTVGG